MTADFQVFSGSKFNLEPNVFADFPENGVSLISATESKNHIPRKFCLPQGNHGKSPTFLGGFQWSDSSSVLPTSLSIISQLLNRSSACAEARRKGLLVVDDLGQSAASVVSMGGPQ